MEERKRRSRALRVYFCITYAVFLINTATYFKEVSFSGPLQATFLGGVYLTYSFLYLLPVASLVLLWGWILSRPAGERLCRAVHVPENAALAVLAVCGFSLVHLFFFADRFVFHIFGFHFNGFVANLVFTRGGIESMGGDTATTTTFVLIALGFVLLQALAWLGAWKAALFERRVHRALRARSIAAGIACLVVIGVFERFTYAVSHIRQYAPVLTAANAFPFYLPLTMRGLGRWMGIEPVKGDSLKLKVDAIRLKYPLAPIRRSADHPTYNIVWLVAESLRWDMLDPEIMPATWDFAGKSAWFKNHYSGGNGTRMGVFSMFYGLHGPYWFPFLDERRSPLLVDILLEDGYQMELFTSARFTYPEFDRTIWSRVPKERLHEAEGGFGWERDRRNVTEMLALIDGRDPSRPFLTFEFFESPHARYHFPPETVIRTPYLEDLNYATMNLERDIGLMKNRYINSCRHLDTQIARIIEHLEARGLLDSTIVLITGDHGEEFMEHGRWGHNSAFAEEQIRVPFVLRVPGRAPEAVERMTSHLDIPATFLRILGVENPLCDFTLGLDLFGPERREFAVLANWDCVAYVDERFTGVFPLRSVGFSERIDRTKTGDQSADPKEFLERTRPRLLEVMKDLKRFSR